MNTESNREKQMNSNISGINDITEQNLIENMTQEQIDRYEHFRRSSFPKAKIMLGMLNGQVSQNSLIVMCGLAKIYLKNWEKRGQFSLIISSKRSMNFKEKNLFLDLI
ncbi:hypothetical protein HZS_3456 [Henneguya salminicola]|nr:hypothetical protein HZS_3456 [Henneguya salminicola]